jgi:hypothetical protein
MGSTLGAKRDPTQNYYYRIATTRYPTCVVGSLFGAYSHTVYDRFPGHTLLLQNITTPKNYFARHRTRTDRKFNRMGLSMADTGRKFNRMEPNMGTGLGHPSDLDLCSLSGRRRGTCDRRRCHAGRRCKSRPHQVD